MRPAGALLLTACLVENPAHHGATGTGTSSGDTLASTSSAASAGSDEASAAATSEASTTTSADATSSSATSLATEPSTSTTAGVESTSTTGSSFEPMMLRHYTPGACDQGPHCSNGKPIPAFIQAFECFTAPAAPFLLTRVGAEIRFVVGQPSATLRVFAFDPVAHLPIIPAVAERPLGLVTTPMTYRDFPLDPPIAVDVLDFCVSIEGGNNQSTLALFTETSTVDPADAFVTLDDPGNYCDATMVNLKQWYMQPNAHYCIDVSVAPP